MKFRITEDSKNHVNINSLIRNKLSLCHRAIPIKLKHYCTSEIISLPFHRLEMCTDWSMQFLTSKKT